MSAARVRTLGLQLAPIGLATGGQMVAFGATKVAMLACCWQQAGQNRAGLCPLGGSMLPCIPASPAPPSPPSGLCPAPAGTPQPPPDAPTKLHAARAIAEENTQRLSRVANGALRGGLHFGGLAAVFYAVQMLSGVYRGRRDFLDSAHGGMAAGALFGISCEWHQLQCICWGSTALGVGNTPTSQPPPSQLTPLAPAAVRSTASSLACS
jgi:hypothetical protein